jgi:diacylglycerol kinase (ATP)
MQDTRIMGSIAQMDESRSKLAVRRRRALVLLNPNARQGKVSIDPVLDHMEDEGLDLKVETGLGRDGLSRCIAERKDAFDCVIIGGGDGTINAAARGLMETGLPLGILPMGTANDLARTLGIPEDLREAADIVVAGQTNAIDIGTVNGHPGSASTWRVALRAKPSNAGAAWGTPWRPRAC